MRNAVVFMCVLVLARCPATFGSAHYLTVESAWICTSCTLTHTDFTKLSASSRPDHTLWSMMSLQAYGLCGVVVITTNDQLKEAQYGNATLGILPGSQET